MAIDFDPQKMFNLLSQTARDCRKQYHLTLGQMVLAMNGMDGEALVCVDGDKGGLVLAHSYRGYYEDLAFEFEAGDFTVRDLRTMARDLIGKTVEGYKGGDYTFDEGTPLWLSTYGCTSGRAIIAVSFDGVVCDITTKQLEG